MPFVSGRGDWQKEKAEEAEEAGAERTTKRWKRNKPHKTTNETKLNNNNNNNCRQRAGSKKQSRRTKVKKKRRVATLATLTNVNNVDLFAFTFIYDRMQHFFQMQFLCLLCLCWFCSLEMFLHYAKTIFSHSLTLYVSISFAFRLSVDIWQRCIEQKTSSTLRCLLRALGKYCKEFQRATEKKLQSYKRIEILQRELNVRNIFSINITNCLHGNRKGRQRTWAGVVGEMGKYRNIL